MARSQQCTQNLSLSCSFSFSFCFFLFHFFSFSFSSSPFLPLSLSDEPSHESRNASTSKQNCTNSTLPAAEEAQHQVAPQLWIPALSSMCLLVQ